MLPLAYSEAQVSVGVGFGPGYIAGPPVCEYGYYNYVPYACAPYGYYGPDWFVSGVFIGAGPWYGWGRGWGGGWGRGWGRGWEGREGWGRGGWGRGGWDGRGARGFAHGSTGFRGGSASNGFHGSN